MKQRCLIIQALMVASMVIPTGCTVQREAEGPLRLKTSAPAGDHHKDELLKWIIQQEERVHALKALQVVRIHDLRNGRALNAQALLALHKPDRYRIRVYSVLGLTLFDFVLSPDGFRFRMPPKGIDLSGKREEAKEVLPDFPVEGLREAFVHSFEADRVEWQELDQAHLLILYRVGKGIHTIKRWFDRNGLTLVREVYMSEQGETLSIDYQDYRPCAREEGLFLPYKIDIDLPQKRLRLEIGVIRYEVNPTFEDEIFDLFSEGDQRIEGRPTGPLILSQGTQ